MATTLRLDHVSLLVRSLDASEKFYTEVLGLEKVTNGTNNPTIRWLGVDGIGTLHITEGDFGKTHLEKQTHFAFSVEDFDGFLAGLSARGVIFTNWHGSEGTVSARADGFRQIFLRDPDDYLVEVNDHMRQSA